MPEGLLALISPAISAAVGGAISMLTVYLTNRSNTARELERHKNELAKHRIELRRTRGEELFVLFDKWATDLHITHYAQHSWVSGIIQRQEGLDLLQKHMPGERTVGRIDMLLRTYFPEAIPAYEHFLKGRNSVNTIAATCEQQASTGEVSTKMLVRLATGIEENQLRSEAVRSSILEQLRTL
ncbi:hypothetical protein O9649_10295 [Achromobacter dolens]|uniref:hypothetical protein n=1 Tax=Achromobacter dolens TaxID=1287738 RepID=UPI0022B8F59C|nr:hypothetical protein [Achromobacter dolens]MCZ8408178.1 hypothetical protein [Achromobacter dolens]